MFTWVLLDGFLNGFWKIWFFIVEICILIGDFWVIFENYSMRMLSIRGNDFIAHWAYEETIHRTLSIRRTNFCICSASGKMITVFPCTAMLSIHGNDFIAPWAYEEMILSHPEHTRKWFYRTLSIRGNDFIAPWAYAEMSISRISRPNRIWFSKISCYRPLGP